MVCRETSIRAGSGGVLVKPEYTRQVAKNPEVDARVAAWLSKQAFQPTLRFTHLHKVDADQLVPWPVLDTWIPQRLNWWISQL